MFNSKTIATIATAIGILASQFYGQSTQSNVRQEVFLGSIEYTNQVIAERDKELSDLRARIQMLEARQR